MMEEKRTYRMYGLVPYNLSEIQKGIQFGHAVVEYANKYGESVDYKKWARQDKTFIILNGGTTNDQKTNNGTPHGTLNQHIDELMLHNIKYAKFREPDLQNAVTAVTFLVDERVWDKENWPDFKPDWESHNDEEILGGVDVETQYDNWVRGFSKDEEEQRRIVFLRDFLNNFKLA